MKIMLLILSLFFTSFAQAQDYSHDDGFWVERDGRQYRCEPVRPTPPDSCAPKCESRTANGTCIRYGADYCGPYPRCVPHCVSRTSSGTCIRYEEDFCGTNAACHENCESRTSNGTCIRYGSDVCRHYP